MPKRKRLFWLLAVFAVVIIAYAYAGEVKLTTYYPAPYGEYKRIITKTLGVGDNNDNGTINASDAPNPNTNPGDAWITGNVGIGTTSPGAILSVCPNGPGNIVLGNPNMTSGGYTGLILGISADSGGYSQVYSIKSSGTEWGTLALNEHGGNVGIGTSAPQAQLDVASSASGIIIPRLTADPTGVNGMIYYNTATNKFRGYENGAWKDLVGGAGNMITGRYTGTGTTKVQTINIGFQPRVVLITCGSGGNSGTIIVKTNRMSGNLSLSHSFNLIEVRTWQQDWYYLYEPQYPTGGPSQYPAYVTLTSNGFTVNGYANIDNASYTAWQ
jgi:hypothetical protein